MAEMNPQCRGCHAEIRWEKTARGKWMPVTVSTGRPHWGDCPKRDMFKRPAPRKNT